MAGVNWFDSSINFSIPESLDKPASITSLKIAVTQKTVNDRTYALAVVVFEN